jgi:redox-sensitive bicupin YhaK (pirin superfamily)
MVVRRTLPHRDLRTIGAWCFLDDYGPQGIAGTPGMQVPPHPHTGLQTVTWLLDGEVRHQDSLGSDALVRPGALNLMTAGRGISHAETSPVGATGTLRGLQLWVALPQETEDGPASFDHQPAGAIPSFDLDGVQVRLMAGTGYGQRSPVPVSSPLVLAELRLDGTAALPLDMEHEERALLVLDGDVRLDRTPLPVGHLTVIAAGTTTTLDGAGTVVLLGGEPVGARYIWWNFVHSDREVIEQAKADWTQQRFPIVPGDHDGWVPLPGA